MIRKILISFLVNTFVSVSYLLAQETVSAVNNSHLITLKTEFSQIKDEFNYGLVYNGLNLGVEYTLVRQDEKHLFTYKPELAFGASFNKGVGLMWRLKPIDVFYGHKFTSTESKSVILGAYLSTNYNWQLYPELQSGHLFWFTSIEIGPQLKLILPYKSKRINILLSNSFAGLASRPEPSTETYYYSLKLSDFITNANSNLKFGSFNLFNHTNFEIELFNNITKRLSLKYEFDYFGYYQNPGLSYLSHSINLEWKIGKL